MKRDLIYQYLDGDLDDKGKEAFEASLASDPTLVKEVELIKRMRSYGNLRNKENHAHQVIHKVGEKFNPQVNASQQTPKTSKLKYIILAIVIMAILAYLLNGFFNKQAADGPSLYAQYAEISDPSFSTRSIDADKLITTAERSFKQKEYQETITSLSALITDDPEFTKAIFYRGYAFIAIGEFNLGRQDLSSLLNNTLYQSSARYHLALSYLKSRESGLAIPYLEAIPESSNYYSRAQEILKTIR